MKNSNFISKTLLAFFLLATSMLTYAQTMINGVVTDAATGEAIIGANVIVKGTTNGTITDFDGNFILAVQEGEILEISYMGYKTIEAKATNGMHIQLGEDTELLEEVVVVGYGVVAGVVAGVGIPIQALRYIIPLRLCTAVFNVGKARALSERPIANRFQAIRKSDLG